MELPKLLENKPQLPSHKFNVTNLASFKGISYADILTPLGHPKQGVSVVGWCQEETCFMVMFELPDFRQVFFHYSEGMVKRMVDEKRLG